MDKILRSLFWDTDEKDIDMARHAPYVIERVLEHGNDAQAAWLFDHYPREAIQCVVETGRQLSARSRNYWRVKLDPSQIDKAGVSIGAPAKYSPIWKY